MAGKKKGKSETSTANLGFEEKLWAAADKLRGHMDSAEYKHVVLGLIFLKYISDTFEARYREIETGSNTPGHPLYIKEEQTRFQLLEDRDEYEAENVFWVPSEARWPKLQAQVTSLP